MPKRIVLGSSHLPLSIEWMAITIWTPAARSHGWISFVFRTFHFPTWNQIRHIFRQPDNTLNVDTHFRVPIRKWKMIIALPFATFRFFNFSTRGMHFSSKNKSPQAGSSLVFDCARCACTKCDVDASFVFPLMRFFLLFTSIRLLARR